MRPSAAQRWSRSARRSARSCRAAAAAAGARTAAARFCRSKRSVTRLLGGIDFGLARRRVRMIDVVLGAVAAPARRQFHALDVQRLVGEGGQRVANRSSRSPACASATRRRCGAGSPRGSARRGFRCAPARHRRPSARASASSSCGRRSPVPDWRPGAFDRRPMLRLRTEQLLQFVDGLLEVLALAEDADLGGHDFLHPRLDRARVLAAPAEQDAVELRLLALHELRARRRSGC